MAGICRRHRAAAVGRYGPSNTGPTVMPLSTETETILRLRNERAWTQEQLANVAGLSLRTVQRIEAQGQASHDSIQALAAALDCNSATLLRKKGWRRPLRAGLSSYPGAVASLAAASILVLVLSMPSVLAQPVMLNVGLTAGDERLVDAQLLSDEGRTSEVVLADELRIELVSSVTKQGDVFIEILLFEPDTDGSFEQVAEPAVLTADRRTASVEFEARSGKRFMLELTPEL